MSMKSSTAKVLAITLSMGLVAGCASQQAEPEPEPTQPCPLPETTRALDEARAAINEAKSLDWLFQGTEELLSQAEAAASECNDERAQELAAQAVERAEASVTDYYTRKGKAEHDQIQTYTNLSDDQIRRLREGEQAWAAGDRRRAYEIFSALNAELEASRTVYDVVRGDSLWKISGKSEIYGDPYQWPLIYKMNRDKIDDADLIHPGQRFDVNKNPTRSDVDAAVDHAKNRGAWSIGEVEQSDRDYLSGN